MSFPVGFTPPVVTLPAAEASYLLNFVRHQGYELPATLLAAANIASYAAGQMSVDLHAMKATAYAHSLDEARLEAALSHLAAPPAEHGTVRAAINVDWQALALDVLKLIASRILLGA